MRSITLIPWHIDFMPAVAELLIERGDLRDTIVLFPHNRPRRHVKALLATHPDLPKPMFMPHMTSIADFVTNLHRTLVPVPPIRANQLDLVETLRAVVNDLRTAKGSLLSQLPKLDHEQFLPWGIRLAKLMDDLMRQEIEPDDLSYMEGEVSAYAAGLLEQLSAIHAEYSARLTAKGWTTSGMDARFITENPDAILEAVQEKQIIAAGFYALSGVEDTFFKRLWEADILHPIIHSDPALAHHERAHWSAAEHTAWLERWHTHAEIPLQFDTPATAPTIRFCEGYDRHSQLAGLTTDMNAATTLDETAVVLPDEGALLPVLHGLPDVEPNISMGYPLERTSLARLVETLLTLQENRREDGRYYWKDLIALIRHPYLRLLGPDEKPLRRIFHVWESTMRQGEKYLDPMDWLPPYGDEVLTDVDTKIAEPLRLEILECCLTRFEPVESLADLGDALTGLATLLHAHGERLWHTYLMDAECLFRLTNSVIPQLKQAEASIIPFSQTTRHAFARRMMSLERVSFEPDPLAGLQVLGVLETRLLHFKRLYILDAVEERLPGTNPYDPLLPDPLRKLLGLPDSRERDNVSGYNFYRLLKGTDEAVIYYQNGIQPGLLDSKSVRSRFVEQLLWEQEKERRELIETGSDLVRAVTFPTSSIPGAPAAIPITESIHAALIDKLCTKGLSPSRLDQYMNCPKRFFYSYLSPVRPLDTVNEDGDRSEFGSMVHEVLKEYLTPFIGVLTELDKLDPIPLTEKFDEVFNSHDLFSRLPLDTRMALKKTGRFRLTQFLASQQTATLLGLEQPLATTVDVDGLTIPLAGQIDRIEQREESIVILDYKTGQGHLPQKKMWDDMELWDRIQTFGPDVVDISLIPDMAAAIRSVQMPVYLHLYTQCERFLPHDAGLIELAKDGKEQLLFGPKLTDEEREESIKDQIPVLIRTLIRHMLLAQNFTPQPGPACTWCDFKEPCGK
ncbi:PD-(D/E)XK nuclease family protein [Pseudodesulfovibrio sp. JC047]|uniref:PD-(D/E)XK nuclease family protein n=1 Tax=Pseudodesulfovibrio sp. JC047 TaxID=2683199 RepID=UPI0013D4A612|nr:PD-(D/E)XK nuclease family protein [Pseudodesulfovibrio sp. JC047]NDV18780.1 PD-(D/E)XK nuclease family protein [Pseudodesulfovibrio sp. JC047]